MLCHDCRSGRAFESVYARSVYFASAFFVLGIVFSGNAVSLPIPSAHTLSEFDLSIALSGVELSPAPFLRTSTFSKTTTAVTAVDPLTGLSGHLATANSFAKISAQPSVSAGGKLPFGKTIFDVNMASRTLAESWWSGPVGGRAIAESGAGFNDLLISVTPDSQLTLAWSFDALDVSTIPTSSFAVIRHMVSIAIAPLAAEHTAPRRVSVGFSVQSQDGKTDWTAYDMPGSTAIRDWLDNTLAPLADSSTPMSGPMIVVPLMADQRLSSGSGTDFKLSLAVSHFELAAEAPPAPVQAVAEKSSWEHDHTMVHWDAESKTLSFDLLPLGQLLDASGRSLSSAEYGLLAGAYLEIDPLQYSSLDGFEGHFTGSGGLKIVAEDGSVLFRATLPSLIFDDRLFSQEGFNLFAPLLDAIVLDLSSSQWLQSFHERMNSEILFLPELFVGIGLPGGASFDGDGWSSDFSAPVNTVLSFAGPEIALGLPGTLLLFLIGLLCLPLAIVRSGGVLSLT